MSTTENGWTKEFPQVEGFYWARRTQTNAPGLTIIQVWQYEDEWFAYRFANRDDIEARDFTRSLYEYLGPLQPSDFEQLAALRETATRARDWLAWWVESDGADIPDGVPSTPDILAALREALTPELAQGEKS